MDVEAAGDAISAVFRRGLVDLDERSADYAKLIVELQGFLDAFAAADLSDEEFDLFRTQLKMMRERAESRRVPEIERRFGRGKRLHTGVYAAGPEIRTLVLNDDEFLGSTTIGEFYLGLNGAAHGGVVAFIFDDALGRLAGGVSRPPARTAYLKTDFRRITPVDQELQVHGVIERIEGRKRFVRGEIRASGELCAEAQGLFVELRPGQA